MKTLAIAGYVDDGSRISPNLLKDLSRLTSLKTLTLDSCTLSPIAVQAISTSLSTLQNLLLIQNKVSINNTNDDLQDSLSNVPCSYLRTLSYWNHENMTRELDPIYEWIILSPISHTLRSLSIYLTLESPEPHGRLLRALGPFLEHLSVEIEGTSKTHWLSSDKYIERLDLRPLTRLKSLRIRARIGPILLFHFLNQISSPSLSLLIISLENRNWDYIPYKQPEPWRAWLSKLARLFSHSVALRAVSRVVFANDIARPPGYELEEDEEEEEENQTVETLKRYLDEGFQAEMSPVKYEVMSFEEAKSLGGAVPVEV